MKLTTLVTAAIVLAAGVPFASAERPERKPPKSVPWKKNELRMWPREDVIPLEYLPQCVYGCYIESRTRSRSFEIFDITREKFCWDKMEQVSSWLNSLKLRLCFNAGCDDLEQLRVYHQWEMDLCGRYIADTKPWDEPIKKPSWWPKGWPWKPPAD